ncbi:MAG: hypothetical protein ACHQ0J_04805 [Candidatus Dormibacterales bacterium]
MKRKRPGIPERRRSLAEINLVGHKTNRVKTSRLGCAHLFGVMPFAVALVMIWANLH